MAWDGMGWDDLYYPACQIQQCFLSLNMQFPAEIISIAQKFKSRSYLESLLSVHRCFSWHGWAMVRGWPLIPIPGRGIKMQAAGPHSPGVLMEKCFSLEFPSPWNQELLCRIKKILLTSLSKDKAMATWMCVPHLGHSWSAYRVENTYPVWAVKLSVCTYLGYINPRLAGWPTLRAALPAGFNNG